MDPINPLNRIIETLRQQMAESAKRMDAPRSGARTDDGHARVRAGRVPLPELRTRIQRRIRSIELDTANGKRRARRIFLESVLAWEFGDQLSLDGDFQRLVEDIDVGLEADSEVSEKLDVLLTELTRI